MRKRVQAFPPNSRLWGWTFACLTNSTLHRVAHTVSVFSHKLRIPGFPINVNVLTSDLLSIYAQDRALIGLPGYEVERFPHLTCYTPTLRDREGIISFASLNADHEAREIKEQIRYFSLAQLPFRWSVLDGGDSVSLKNRLITEGFVESHARTLMQHRFLIQPAIKLPSNRGLRLEHIDSERGLRDVLAVYSAAFNRSHSYLYEGFARQMQHDPNSLSMFCIYHYSTPVAAAWTIYPTGSQFPEMSTAAVVEPCRGRRLGVALDVARVEEVHSRFYDRVFAVVSDDRVALLKEVGFESLTAVSTMRLADVSIAGTLAARRNSFARSLPRDMRLLAEIE